MHGRAKRVGVYIIIYAPNNQAVGCSKNKERTKVAYLLITTSISNKPFYIDACYSFDKRPLQSSCWLF